MIPQKTEGHAGFPSPMRSEALDPGQLWTCSRDVTVGTVPCPSFLLPLLSYGLTAMFSRQTLLAFPFMSRRSDLCFVSGFGAVSSICIVLSSVPLLQREGEEKQSVLCPQTMLLFSCECRLWAQRKTQALHSCRSSWSDSQVWAPPAQPITNAEAPSQ